MRIHNKIRLKVKDRDLLLNRKTILTKKILWYRSFHSKEKSAKTILEVKFSLKFMNQTQKNMNLLKYKKEKEKLDYQKQIENQTIRNVLILTEEIRKTCSLLQTDNLACLNTLKKKWFLLKSIKTGRFRVNYWTKIRHQL